MKADKLREIQAPFKERYRSEPEAALIMLRATGSLDPEGVACSVDVGRQIVEAGLHPATGGNGLQACSGDMLLQALVACAGVTLKAVATALDVELTSGEVRAEGEVDMRGTLGIDREAPVGFESIRLAFDLESDAEPVVLAKVLELTERYCVVYQSLTKGVEVSIDQQVRPAAA